jgi:hypothetical protein
VFEYDNSQRSESNYGLAEAQLFIAGRDMNQGCAAAAHAWETYMGAAAASTG